MNYWDQKTITKIRKGYFSAKYFLRTKKILTNQNNWSEVTMQIFQKQKNSVLCGVKETLALLKIGCGLFKGKKWCNLQDKLLVKSLQDGDFIKPNEAIMHITGPYLSFAHLESLYLGILARRTLVATNCHKVVKASQGKPVYFFSDRFDHFLNQEGDGYAALTGGITQVCTSAQAAWGKSKPIGTIPHSLIALNKGNTLKAAWQFVKQFPNIPLVALVDYNNDCVNTSLALAKSLGKKLCAVRLDTTETLTDISLKNIKSVNKGVCPKLVKIVRKKLNQAGYNYVKIIVSGGFNETKIRQFEKEKVPVDAYGVGSALLKGNNDFTADIVKVDEVLCAKTGRSFKNNKRMKVFKL